MLVRLNGVPVTGFESLEAVLDESVGGKVRLELERGGQPYAVQVTVEDLHAVTPASYLEFGDAVVHTLSYQEARHFHLPISGVFVAASGYSLDAAGVPRGAVITAVNSKSVATLADFEAQIATLGDGARFTVRYVTMDDPHRAELRSVYMDRRWFPARHCVRNDTSGYWDCIDLAEGPAAAVPAGGAAPPPLTGDPIVRLLAPSLVGMTFDMPYPLSGVNERNYRGTGLIVDAERGLVITDRNTVPVSIGDVRLTFSDTLEIPGQGGLRPSAPQPRGGAVRPGAARGDAGAGGHADRAAAARRRECRGGGAGSPAVHSSRAPPRLPKSTRCCCHFRGRVAFRDSNISVATLVNPPDDLVGVLADQRRTRARPVGELRLRQRPRAACSRAAGSRPTSSLRLSIWRAATRRSIRSRSNLSRRRWRRRADWA